MASDPWQKGRPINLRRFFIIKDIKKALAKTMNTPKEDNQYIQQSQKVYCKDHLILRWVFFKSPIMLRQSMIKFGQYSK